MSLFSKNAPVQPACTNIVHRPMGGIAGLREVHDDVSRLTVTAFPMTMAKDISQTHGNVAACYILASHKEVYLGETSSIVRRLSQHANDPSKAFALEVYVISGYERAWFDKTMAIYLQHRLTGLAEQAGLVDIVKGVNPQVLELPHHRRASLDTLVTHAELQLFDAGCRVFRSNFASQRTVVPASAVIEFEADADENGEMQIDVIAAPAPGGELELDYCDLWARGYPAQDGFVVMAGSEVRTSVNASVNPILHTRRAELADAQALAPIPGVQDRQRLCVAVWFPSAAIAAKVVTGAHTHGGKWGAPRYPQPILIAT